MAKHTLKILDGLLLSKYVVEQHNMNLFSMILICRLPLWDKTPKHFKKCYATYCPTIAAENIPKLSVASNLDCHTSAACFQKDFFLGS